MRTQKKPWTPNTGPTAGIRMLQFGIRTSCWTTAYSGAHFTSYHIPHISSVWVNMHVDRYRRTVQSSKPISKKGTKPKRVQTSIVILRFDITRYRILVTRTEVIINTHSSYSSIFNCLRLPSPHDSWCILVKRRHMVWGILVNTGSGNGLLPDGTKPLPEPILTLNADRWNSFQWLASTVIQVTNPTFVWNVHIWKHSHISKPTMSS